MNKKYKAIFSRFAEDDLFEIINYFYQINPFYSKELLLAVEKRVKELENNPNRKSCT